MAIDIHIDTTIRQDAKLTLYLNKINTTRIAHGLTPYATTNDLLKDILIDTVKNLIKAPDLEYASKLRDAYLDATDAVQAQVKTLLGIP